MSEVPNDLRYTAEHEWVRVTDNVARLGITDFAQEALGDVVYVTLPEVGAAVERGAAFGEVESTKSVSDLFAPVDGPVITRNDLLEGNPELINTDPYGDGWIIEIEISDASQLDALLDPEAYGELSQ